MSFFRWISLAISDARYAVRGLGRSPGFASIAIATLAVAIGANATIFGFLDALLLRPLPFRDADALVRIESIRGSRPGRISMEEVADLRGLSSVRSIAAYRPGAEYNASGGGRPEEIHATLATANLFEVLGTPPVLGQSWPASYDVSRNFGLVISHGLWRRRFASDPAILGRRIALDAYDGYTIFGVAPPGMEFPSNAELFRSIFINDRSPVLHDRNARVVYAVARLSSGVSVARAAAEAHALAVRLASEYPATNSGIDFRVLPIRNAAVGSARPYVLLLAGAVGLLLLIACTNVASLLLSRTLARRRELALRTALGASRRRIVAQLVTEGLVLSLCGGVLGVALAYWWTRALRAVLLTDLPSWASVRIDSRVLAFSFAVSLLAGVAAGLVPAWKATSPALAQTLKEGLRGSSAGRADRRLRGLFVTGQIALALPLFAGAALMIQSLVKLHGQGLGFDSRGLLTLRVAMPWRTYTPERAIAFHRHVLERLRVLPGVDGAALTGNLTIAGNEDAGRNTLTLEGQSVDAQRGNPYVTFSEVDAEFFRVMAIPLRRGRLFGPEDSASTTPVAVVGERLAARLWPGAEAIGRRLKLGEPESRSRWLSIVGVVGDVTHDHLTGDPGLDVYVSCEQLPTSNVFYVVRTRSDPNALGAAATRVVWSVDADQSTFDVSSMERRVEKTIWRQRLAGALLSAFAMLALTLAAVGIYGIMAQAVGQRTREIGVRMAVGAKPWEVLRMVLGEALRLAGVGAMIGLGAALVLGRALGHLLFRVQASDPGTLAAVTGTLGLTAVLAAWLPARRAARIDPVEALRAE